MTSGLGSRDHVYRHRPVVPVEQQLIDEHVRPGARALDVGTAATGRSAIMLRDAGAEVHSIEINAAALAEFAAGDDRRDLHLAVADMVALPFADRSFDIVLIGLHGSDYLIGRTERAAAFAEAARVLRSGGVLVFNAFNPAGLALSPSGLRSAAYLKVRARYLRTAGFARRTMIDVNGLRLHQAVPRRIIREVESTSRLRLATMTNQSGSSRSRWLVGLLASAPYYVFVKDHSN
jgi:ubiquinone/menaquinone biosynthesis C-methylase UbiE